jgi:NAD kinase
MVTAQVDAIDREFAPATEFDLRTERLSKAEQLVRQREQEVARPARLNEPQRIDLDKIVIAPKLSKLEYDMLRLGLDQSAMLKRYEALHAPVERILTSHNAQKDALNTLRRVFSPRQFLTRNEVSPETTAAADLVIAFGGDNHFQYVSHAREDGFILGINSDPGRSEGVLVPHSADEIMDILGKLARGKFLVEEWTRLEGTVNGKKIPQIICEYFLGEYGRLDMSRHILQFLDTNEEQKGSGIIVSTGAGSSGWFDSEIADFIPGGAIFPRTSGCAHIFVTAPFRGRLTGGTIRHQLLKPGEELVIGSLNDSEGIVGCDALERIPFPFGAEARIRVSDRPLKVLRVQ